MKCHMQLSISNSLVRVPFLARHNGLCVAKDRKHLGMMCYMPFSCSDLASRFELSITARHMLPIPLTQLCTPGSSHACLLSEAGCQQKRQSKCHESCCQGRISQKLQQPYLLDLQMPGCREVHLLELLACLHCLQHTAPDLHTSSKHHCHAVLPTALQGTSLNEPSGVQHFTLYFPMPLWHQSIELQWAAKLAPHLISSQIAVAAGSRVSERVLGYLTCLLEVHS